MSRKEARIDDWQLIRQVAASQSGGWAGPFTAKENWPQTNPGAMIPEPRSRFRVRRPVEPCGPRIYADADNMSESGCFMLDIMGSLKTSNDIEASLDLVCERSSISKMNSRSRALRTKCAWTAGRTKGER
jgi:hypothetical protein